MGSNKVATAVVFDISARGSVLTENGLSFFERAKTCLQRIILRKIFSNESDEIGLILIGAENTENRLYKGDNNYENIHEHTPLRIPNWNFLNTVDDLKMSSIEISDWVEGFVIGLNFLHEECKGKRFRDRQLVVFTNTTSASYSMSQLDQLVGSVINDNVTVIFIGVDLKEDENMSKILFEFVEKLEKGLWLNFKEAEDEFQYYEKKRKMKRLTKITLDIGVKIKVPMKWMKLTAEETRIAWRDPLNSIQPLNNIRQEPLKIRQEPLKIRQEPSSSTDIQSQPVVYKTETDVVEYVKFGGTKVFLSYADQDALKRKSGPPSFTYMGSVKQQRINRAMITGSEVYVAVPDGTAKSHALVTALISALQSEKKLGLARRIVSNNGKIYLGLLLPVSDELGKALYFVKLPFADCIRSVLDRPLPQEKDERLTNLIDNYIDSKMLDDDPKNILSKDPSFQHRSHILYSLAKGYDEKLIPEHIKKLYNPYPELNKAAEPIISDLNKHYYIKYSESGKSRLKETVYVQDEELEKIKKKDITEDEVKEIMEINRIVQNLGDQLSDEDIFEFKIDTQSQNTEKLVTRF